MGPVLQDLGSESGHGLEQGWDMTTAMNSCQLPCHGIGEVGCQSH